MQEASVLVPTGSVWKYLDDGTDQGTAWREPAFDDSQWKSGPAQLGFGETDQATTIGFGPDEWNKYRHDVFSTPVRRGGSDKTIRALELHVLRDDGVAVFLNGREVFRDNLIADGQLRHVCSRLPLPDADETTFLKCPDQPQLPRARAPTIWLSKSINVTGLRPTSALT